MGFYRDRVLPHCIDVACGLRELIPARQKLAQELRGTVLEIGFGSGLNLPYLPSNVTRVLAVEPSERARSIAKKRIESATCPVQFVGLDAEVLQVPDASADAALSTFTLCTIPDVLRALREVRRTLRAGGRLYFLEHGRAPEASIARWQDRLNGLQSRICGGCQLNRDIPVLLEQAGFVVETVDATYIPRTPRTHGYVYSGWAHT
jgi:ubiquinone/menaquinone biosynthesis C-methylase UbiE